MARTVLLADDSVTAQNMGRRILMDAGYDVITVNNGSAALKKIHESRPDLIVLDVYMPGYGGLEVCQRLKESRETSRIPILLSVGKMEPFKSDEAKRVRADGHIVKPFEASELLAALTKLEDRIVPQADASRGKKAKSEKKARSWHADEDPAQAPEEWTEKIAYLAQVKEKLIGRKPEKPAESVEVVEPAKPEAAISVAAADPAPEMPVIASTEAPDEQQQEINTSPGEDNGLDAEPIEIATGSPAPVMETRATESETTERVSSPQQQEPASPEISAAFEQVESPAIEHQPEPGPEIAELGTASPEISSVEDAPQVVPVKARWVAENVALTAEEAALELEQEMEHAQRETASAANEINIPNTEIRSAEPEATIPSASQEVAPEPEERNGATFAAAASASPSAVTVHQQNPLPEEDSGASHSEAAAAWQNWQQIRDSVMTPQSANAIAESIAEAAKAVVPVNAPSAQADAPAGDSKPESDAASVDGETLASIVDSVLAELKPKLMQEIAKKLKK